MNLTINGKAIKKQTLIILSLIIAGAAATQIATVNHFISYHPRLAPLGGLLISAITLLHQPWVEQLIFQQSEQFPGGGKVDTSLSVTPVPILPDSPATTNIQKD